MVENIEVECSECNAIYFIKHNLNKSRYDIEFCAFCSGEDIEMKKIMKKRKIIIDLNIPMWSIYELRKPLAI